MDFLIGLIVGLFFGGLFGFFASALMIANGNTDQEPDPDSGVDDVIADALAELKKQKAEIEESKSKQTLTFNFGSLDELRKKQAERLDSEAWQDDMYYDAQNGEAENETDN